MSLELDWSHGVLPLEVEQKLWKLLGIYLFGLWNCQYEKIACTFEACPRSTAASSTLRPLGHSRDMVEKGVNPIPRPAFAFSDHPVKGRRGESKCIARCESKCCNL